MSGRLRDRASGEAGVANGLAWDGRDRLLYVTGKLWRSVHGPELRR